MTCHFEKKRYLVGFECKNPFNDNWYFDIDRTVTLPELAEIVLDIQIKGHRYPAIPPEDRPEVLFVSDLNNQEDGDCYHDLISTIKQLKVQKGVKAA